MRLLLATNALTDRTGTISGFASAYDLNGDGILDSHEITLRTLAHDVYSRINSA
jgi:hypothetical protein